MSPVELLSVGLIVGLNNFAVAVVLGSLGQERRRWRIVGVFGVFEFLIPLVGLLIGSLAAELIADAGRFIGAALLVALGLLAIRAARGGESKDQTMASRVTTTGGLVALAAGLSMDNLVVGFAFGLREVNPFLLAGVITGFAVVYTLIGLRLGSRGRQHWGARAEAGSGALLLLLGLAVAAGLVA